MLLNKENGKLSFDSKIFLILFVPATAYLLLVTILSLSWRMQADHAMVFYISFLIDHFHKIPYAEIYDMNFPGTYFISIIIGKLTNYSELGVRLADIIILALISFFTFRFTKKFSLKSAYVSVVVFALIYFLDRPSSTLQREYYIVLFLSVILFLNSENIFKKNVTDIITGFLIGMCFTIKPQSSIIILAFTLYRILDLKYFEHKTKKFKEVFLYFLTLMCGFFLPVIAMITWLYSLGALGSFVDMVINYLPHYASLNKEMATLVSVQTYSNLFGEVFKLNERPLFLISAAIGVYFVVFRFNIEKRLKKIILLLCILSVFFSIYTVFTGQFWLHHWIPFTYLTSILFSLCFIENQSLKNSEKHFVAIFAAMAVISLFVPYQGFVAQLKGQDADPDNLKRISGISDYLDKNAAEKDEIQPLDYMEGTGDALLKSRKNISTRFIYDIQFFHNVSSPYIINLRKEFITSLNSKQPKFIIRFISGRTYPKGIDTSTKFEELENFINENYVVDLTGDVYLIYKHK